MASTLTDQGSIPSGPLRFSGEFRSILSVSFFAALFFLCSADLFFTTRVHGLNIRWGQFLLLLAALPSLRRLWDGFQNRSSEGQSRLKFLAHWVPFFLVYGLAAICSATPLLTGIKWGWGLFNIGLAALVCLSPRQDDSLERGFEWGVILIAAFIWLEAIAIYIFGSVTSFQELGSEYSTAISLFSIPIGYAQPSWGYMGFQTYRPNAFYYEPSYAGCALTFAFFLLYFRDLRRPAGRSGWIPAIAASAVILCSSRTGILSTFLFFAGVPIVLAWRRKVSPLWRITLKAFVISALLIGLFCIFPNGRKYLQFISGPLGSDSTSRFHKKGTSEGDRLSNAKESFELWMQHPLLGNGVVPQDKANNRGLSQFSMVTWSEVGLESGTLGVLAFLYAILANMALAWKKSRNADLQTVVLVAWVIHFTVQFLLSQTFPRLDYWLLFFLSIRLLVKSGETQRGPSRD